MNLARFDTFVNDVGLASLVLHGPQYSSEHHVNVCYNIVGVFSAIQDVVFMNNAPYICYLQCMLCFSLSALTLTPLKIEV